MEQRLLKDAFWNKKIDHATRIRDANKDGNISFHDYELVLERYGKLTKASPLKLDACKRFMRRFCEMIGLKDKLTYNQFKKGIAKLADNPNKDDFYCGMFDILDVDGNGVITYSEWELHYKCLGIKTDHAKASFHAMDLNRSGTITRDEFVAYHCEFFFSAGDKLGSSIMFGPLD